ncbi:YopX family protein [Campylobacter insulaenigrae]|uniref:YopX family protein n=1 Tax=Campylobacter insulaenigrae TaxID=260714 RepID=UPI00215293CF|nr:YopX family protein [Campylobacter insulaenigrae]MCR6580377.1 YopX family protein [Campylobacter insulaenigrae]
MKLKDFDFRIWNNNAKKYESECIIDALGFVESVFKQLTYENETINYELELWTRLYDKNDKKIYEGDIIRYPTINSSNFLYYVVLINPEINVFELFRATMDLEKNKLLDISKIDRLSLYLFKNINKKEEREIIGNIHQNEDLLK